MSHCITDPSAPIKIARGVASVHMVPAASDNISWLIEHTPGQVALVDGPSLKPVIDYCISHDLVLTHIINTHIHGDHIGVNYGLPRGQKDHRDVFVEPVEVWGSERTQDSIPHLTRPLVDGERLRLGGLRGVVWLTEGHLDGHISLTFWSGDETSQDRPTEGSEAGLFCGDTMFAAGCGRLFDGPAEKMYHSLQKLCELPSDTLVFPAHEYTLDNLSFAQYAIPDNPDIVEQLRQCQEIRSQGRATLPSTIKRERATNPFVRAPDVESFAELRGLKDRGAHRD
jgi:hydroxyacylglutathione hydrolase